MHISPEYVKELAARARLSLDEEACGRYAADLEELEVLCAPLLEVRADRDARLRACSLTDLREDVVGVCLPREAIAEMAPTWEDGCVSVPRTVTGGE